MSRTTEILTLSLPPKLAREAEKIAKEESRTKSELMREALRYYISQKRWERIRYWGDQAAKRLGKKLNEQEVAEMITEMRKENESR